MHVVEDRHDAFAVVREVFLDTLEIQLASVAPWCRKRAMEIVDRFLETHLDEKDACNAITPLYEEGAVYPSAFVVCPWPIDSFSDALVIDHDGAHRVSLHDYVEHLGIERDRIWQECRYFHKRL